jgi:dipeptidase D
MQHITLRNQEPQILWNHFADINAIPRASKKEDRIVEFMVAFGKNLGLETIVDPVGNVIIRKPASAGMENRKTVVVQSHLDMVHQKNTDVQFDFDTEGIKMKVEGDWVKAEGTTLGADNGLGVAAIMSLLSSKNIVHPPLEALFTIDEETGMTGAQGLQAGYLTGEILLNLDTEEDDEIDIGCAGGIDITLSKKYEEVALEEGCLAFKIEVKGLQGGHSGMDIHKGFGNANKIMNHLLLGLGTTINIAQIKGGGLRNAIPRESFSIITCKQSDATQLADEFDKLQKLIVSKFKSVEPGLNCTMTKTSAPSKVMDKNAQEALLQAMEKAINGVYKMSEEIPDLVETSNNIARVLVEKGNIRILCLTRSSKEETKMQLSNSLKTTFEDRGFNVEFSGSYPGWNPNKDSAILKVLTELYENMFHKKPAVVACHAGLECGILGTHYPNMDMISFGPTIKGAHSPDERASISSSVRFWNFLQEILKNIPLKGA